MSPLRRSGCSRAAPASPECCEWVWAFLFLMVRKSTSGANSSVRKVKGKNLPLVSFLAITRLSAQKAGDFMAFKMTEGRFNKRESKA